METMIIKPSPLQAEVDRLRALVASLERSLRITAEHRDSLQRRLDILSNAAPAGLIA
ncbi:MAG: hypothetical protein ABIO71_12425 [Caldimonas sp.]